MEKVEIYDTYIDVLDAKLAIYYEQKKVLEKVLSEEPTNPDYFIDYYIVTNTIEKLLEFKITIAKGKN